MRLATWNVNSIKARQERLVAWLGRHQPDVLCLQELKIADEAFPVEVLRQAGYHATFAGQKTYNGVAIVSKEEPQDVVRGFGDGHSDTQARSIAATVGGLRIYSLYAPNGQSVGSEKHLYKLDWYKRLGDHLRARFAPSDPLVLCGDFNVAPSPQDVANPAAWASTVLFDTASRAALESLVAFGFVDVFANHHPEGGQYSWWDYRMLAFAKNNGLRIDHVLATNAVAARSRTAEIDRQERKGKLPSDHAPVTVDLD
jgi:exodeoxyribonuclease III